MEIIVTADCPHHVKTKFRDPTVMQKIVNADAQKHCPRVLDKHPDRIAMLKITCACVHHLSRHVLEPYPASMANV